MPRAKSPPATTEPLHELFAIARALSASHYVDGLLKEIVRVTERLVDAEAASLLILDEGGRNLYFKVATGEKGPVINRQTIPADRGVAGWVLKHGQALRVKDARKDPRFSQSVDQSSGFNTRSLLAVPFRLKKRVIGVCEAINKRRGTFTAKDEQALMEMAELAAVCVENARVTESQENFFENTIEILTAAIEAANPLYLGHPARVAETAAAIGRRLGLAGAAAEDLYYGALLHDVGMVAVNHKTLMEHASPRAQERSVEQAHPLLGADLLKGVLRFKGIIPIVRHHHEHWDGTGHPDHLAGEAIPLGARIVGLVEELEDLRFTSLSDAEIKPMMLQRAKNGSGTLFDPRVVEAYLTLDAQPHP